MNKASLLFFDTETDGFGGFRKPLRQNLMQLAWVVTDEVCTYIHSHSFFVQGEHNVSSHVPHGITTEYANCNGVAPQEVLNKFMDDVMQVCKNGGYVVAHNAQFDVDVIMYALRGCEIRPGFSLDGDHVFCSMRDTRIMNYCALPRARGKSFKFPKLDELYACTHGGLPAPYVLHDALGDVHTLRDSFSVLLSEKVITLNNTHDITIKASEVAVVAGMMFGFKKYPFEIAQRVLELRGPGLGRPDVPALSAPPVVGEAEAADAEPNNGSTHYICGGEIGDKRWGIVGCVNGVVKDGELEVEIKNRVEQLFTHTPPYHRIEVEVYMRMTGARSCRLIQRVGSVTSRDVVVYPDDDVWHFILTICGNFFIRLFRLAASDEKWSLWCNSNDWSHRCNTWETV